MKELPAAVTVEDSSVPGSPCPPSPHSGGQPTATRTNPPVDSLLPAGNDDMEAEQESHTNAPAKDGTKRAATLTAAAFLRTTTAGALPTKCRNKKKKGKKTARRNQMSAAPQGTSPTLLQLPREPTADDHLVNHHRPPAGSADKEGFQQIMSKGAHRRRARDIAAAAALPVPRGSG